ncbi:MAG: PP2C family protein-serine/threonine phosphatase, partial [Terracidiphilus sp.]
RRGSSMARWLRSSGFLAVSLLCSFAAAQAATPVQGSTAAPAEAVNVTLGQSAVSLYGPWKFTIGDSPTDAATGKPLWAEADFDDSEWETVDLTPPTGAVDPLSGMSGWVPGWTVRGHPGYWGYAWYRLRVRVRAPGAEPLKLMGPPDLDDIYQIFANGELVGHFGDFTKSPPIVFYIQPAEFSLSRPGGDSGSFTEVLALRVYMTNSTLSEAADVGGLHSAPLLGSASTLDEHYQISWLELVRGYALVATETPMFGLMAVLAFTMLLFDRSDRVYLWIGNLFLLEAILSAWAAIGSFTQYIGIFTSQLLSDSLLTALTFAGWIMVWWVWFGRKRPSWTPRAAFGLAVLFFVTIVPGQQIIPGLVPHRTAAFFLAASVIVRLLVLALQLWIVFQGIRDHGLESWLVLPAVLLWGVGTFSSEFARLHVKIRWEVFGLSIRINQISNLLLVLVVAVLLLRRLLKSRANQRQMALDVKQAQEVQQMILPEARTTLPGLVVESEYRPAREVGGDFFLIIPNRQENSLLIVAGDVTGKGLQAGMLVALLVGASRTAASVKADPVFVLKQMNERLLGRNNAQATCLALKIDADGAVTIANAGHMTPYLNGEPLEIEGALPLGMLQEADFSVKRLGLEENDTLVVLSDGVVEAMDAEGHLFGFERLHRLLGNTVSAHELANAAQSFGQEDDISVISITRIAVAEPVPG